MTLKDLGEYMLFITGLACLVIICIGFTFICALGTYELIACVAAIPFVPAIIISVVACALIFLWEVRA